MIFAQNTLLRFVATLRVAPCARRGSLGGRPKPRVPSVRFILFIFAIFALSGSRRVILPQKPSKRKSVFRRRLPRDLDDGAGRSLNFWRLNSKIATKITKISTKRRRFEKIFRKVAEKIRKRGKFRARGLEVPGKKVYYNSLMEKDSLSEKTAFQERRRAVAFSRSFVRRSFPR
jgi:hypothetical protein